MRTGLVYNAKKFRGTAMKTPIFSRIFERTISIQIISLWTILVVVGYLVGDIWLKNNIITLFLVWLTGVLGFRRIISWYYSKKYGGKEKEDEQISNLIYRAILETSPDSVAATDLLGNYIFANKQTAILHGYESTEGFIGKSAFSHFPTNFVSKAVSTMNLTLADGAARNIEFDLLRLDGSLIHAELSAALVKNEFGIPVAFIAITRDITERKQVSDQLRDMNNQLKNQLHEIEKLQSILHEQAIQDPLTGLYNRRYMEKSLKQEISRSSRSNRPFSLILLDMDNLKTTNDLYGHTTGDLVILKLASLLKYSTREEDIICRYGGDEFLVILQNTDTVTAITRLAERERNNLGKNLGDNLDVHFSGGCATYPMHGETIEELIGFADNALYKVKAEKKQNKATLGAV